MGDTGKAIWKTKILSQTWINKHLSSRQRFTCRDKGREGKSREWVLSWQKPFECKENKARILFFFCVLSGSRLYSILFRFRISKFKKGWDAARVAIGIQLDNILPWLGRDIPRYIGSITAQLSWQIYKSRGSPFLEVRYFWISFSPHHHHLHHLTNACHGTNNRRNAGRISFICSASSYARLVEDYFQ